jgi:hypothetical protein
MAYVFYTQAICIIGADEANRTPDLLITNQLLYQLSYISNALIIAEKLRVFCCKYLE